MADSVKCPECQDTGKVLVLVQDPATGDWTHMVEARCSADGCDAGDEPDEPTDQYSEIGGSD